MKKDEAILQKMRSGDPAGLEELMDAYLPYVSAVVWNILRNAMAREDAEEVASDVFLAAWQKAEDIQPQLMRPWLGAVARNMARTRLRKAGADLPLEEDILELPDTDGPEPRMERAEERTLVRQAVDSLPQPDREIFLRHYYYAQSVREVGAAMGLNESTVKTRLRRGREKLKTMLTRWCAV